MADTSNSTPPPSRGIARLLGGIERVGNALPHPAMLFAGLAVVCSFGSGNMNQANTIAESAFNDLGHIPYWLSGGVAAALVAATLLTPRGDYGRQALLPHNVPFVLLGAGLLWFGWFGFNPGSTTTGDGEIGRVAVTTNLAAAAGAVVAMITSWFMFKKPDASMTLNGALAGLVSITAEPLAPTLTEATIIGAITGGGSVDMLSVGADGDRAGAAQAGGVLAGLRSRCEVRPMASPCGRCWPAPARARATMWPKRPKARRVGSFLSATRSVEFSPIG